MICAVVSFSTPQTTRSGLLKSLSAAPSLRNSGLLAMLKGRSPTFALMRSRTAREVPTGTVDLTTTVLGRAEGPSSRIASPMSSAAPKTYFRSACPSSSEGVPTQMKMISASRYASLGSVVYLRRPAPALISISSVRPGS